MNTLPSIPSTPKEFKELSSFEMYKVVKNKVEELLKELSDDKNSIEE